jgi:disulfide bond formation protein DsbB
MIKQLQKIAHSRWYWMALLLLALSFLMVALYYQYILEELPCVLCIQVRILMLCLAFIGLNAYIVNSRWGSRAGHILAAVVAAALLDRSYQLLGTERGFIFGDCGFDLGLPSWLALDSWFPHLFRVESSCGYTPELAFGITMAEALIVFSTLFFFLSLVLTVMSFMRNNH